jgi:hypothetical protein
MNLRVREMRSEEAVLVIEYFHSATPEDSRAGGCRAADLQCDAPAPPQRSAGRRRRSAIVPCIRSGEFHYRRRAAGRRRRHGRPSVIIRTRVAASHEWSMRPDPVVKGRTRCALYEGVIMTVKDGKFVPAP